MGYKKQEFINYPNAGYTVLTAEHLNHMEEGIANALIPEATRQITESEDLFKNSTTYWNSGFCQTHSASAQTFSNDIFVAINGTFNHTVNYITSPLIKVESQFDHKLILGSGQFLRQMFIFNSKGQLLCDFGNNIQGKTFSSGLRNIKATIKGSTEFSATYPALSQIESDTNLLFNSAIIQDLNNLYKAESSNPTEIATYVANEVVYLSFNLYTTVSRPTTEEEVSSWFLTQVLKCKLVKTILYNAYELTSLILPKNTTKDYFKSPLFNKVVEELGEFKSDIGMSNIKAQVKTTTTIYSEVMTENFYPEAYHGYYVDSNFAVTDFTNLTYTGARAYDGYKITIPIPIDLSIPNVSYSCTGNLRHFALLSGEGALLYWGQHASNLALTSEYIESLNIDPLEVKYICVSNRDESLSTFKFIATSTRRIVTYELPNLKLAAGQGSGDSTGASNIVDLTNVDRIVAIGDSYTESHYTIKDKAWISKVSLLSDYNYDNFAISGDTYRGQLNKIRTGTYSYNSTSGVTWEQLHPTHTILISKTNDTKYMDCQQFIYDMVATIETTKGLGAIPIIATEYHVSNHNFVQSAFDYYAKKYGGYYIDLTEKDYTLRGNDYSNFWGGSHPGTRPNHLFSDVITDYINKNLPRPYSAIKIFRARDTSLVSNLDNYLFGNIEERAEKFKEISICHSALREPKYYDYCTNRANSKVESEYCKLIANIPVSFNKVCLIDVILPTTVHDISEVQLVTNELEGVNCYVKDVLAEPYPSPAFCRRFDIPQELTDDQVKVGNKYTSNKSKDATYTVVEILRNQQVESESGFVNGTILICSGNKTTSAYSNSILTLTSGEGEATLNCSYEAVGLSSDYPAGKQDIGHYKLLNNFGLVDGQTLKRAVDYDKITFLLVSDGEFSLNKVQVEFKGNITKTRATPTYNNTLATNYTSDQISLLAYKKFDDTDIGYWKKATAVSQACEITPELPVDNCLPKGISKIITLTSDSGTIVQPLTNYITARPTQNAVHKVRIWARYFPDIFDPNTMSWPDQASITEDSFDWAKLNIQLYPSQSYLPNNTVKLTKLIGLHWTEVEVDIVLPPTIGNNWYIGLSVEDKPIQIAYCEII